ncbi:MAG: polysaccharide biosynthesis/export family protein [Cyanobacteria bacterium REEB498]|nr:polysaccharide biosynthesis/export family protein [Cyanobacteria bacterium REEB498]
MPATCVALPLLLAALPAGIASEVSDQYILGAGDALDLQLHDIRSYSGPLDVLSDGTAALPLVGTVMHEGFTLPQATAHLTRLYGRQLRRPELTLRLVRPPAAPLPMPVVVAAPAPPPAPVLPPASPEAEPAAAAVTTDPTQEPDVALPADTLPSTPDLQETVVRASARLPESLDATSPLL